MIYFSSDAHYFHKNVIRYCNRPFDDVIEMNEAMINHWNTTVLPDDLVYFLGDFGFCTDANIKKITARLMGRKILVLGNHDKGIKKIWERTGNTLGWDEIHHQLKIQVGHREVILSHYPYPPTAEEMKGIDLYQIRFMDRRAKDEGNWLFHGHIHEKGIVKRRMINVGVDVWGFKPVSIDKLVEIMDEVDSKK